MSIPIIAQVDPTIGSFISLVGSLGSAGAAVVVVWFFLDFLRRKGEADGRREDELAKRYEEFIGRQSEVIKDNSAALRDFRAAAITLARSNKSS